MIRVSNQLTIFNMSAHRNVWTLDNFMVEVFGKFLDLLKRLRSGDQKLVVYAIRVHIYGVVFTRTSTPLFCKFAIAVAAELYVVKLTVGLLGPLI